MRAWLKWTAGLAAHLVNPVIAMLLGVAVLDEQVTSGEWLATGFTLLGVVVLLAERSPGGAEAGKAPSRPGTQAAEDSGSVRA